MRKANKTTIAANLAALPSWEASMIERLQVLNIPGAVDCVRREIADVRQRIAEGDCGPCCAAHIADIRSRVEYAERGLYSRVEGKAWIYA